jgi:hypothetical protein
LPLFQCTARPAGPVPLVRAYASVHEHSDCVISMIHYQAMQVEREHSTVGRGHRGVKDNNNTDRAATRARHTRRRHGQRRTHAIRTSNTMKTQLL